MDNVDLQLIARSRVDDPLNTWPQHNSRHSCTLLGNWLFDWCCLRCWLERVATEKLQKKPDDPAPAEVPVPVSREVSSTPLRKRGRASKGAK